MHVQNKMELYYAQQEKPYLRSATLHRVLLISSSSKVVRDATFMPLFQKPLVRQPGDSLTLEKMHCQVHMQQPKRPHFCRSWLSKFPTRSKRIDVISRITFPLVFALFNITYWSTYLFREDKDGD